MPILNIELGEYDALRQRKANLEAENQRLQKVIEELKNDGKARVIAKTITITKHVPFANPHTLDTCEEYTELTGFDDVHEEVCAKYRAELEQGIKTHEQEIINLQKQQLAGKDQLLRDAQNRIDRLMKRGWWDRLWNKGVE